MPMVPPAPPIFSTITLWPSVLPMDSRLNRATVSVGPPAAAGTTSVIVFVGYAACATAICGASAAASANTAAESTCLIEAIGQLPLVVFGLRRFPTLASQSRARAGLPQLPLDY